MPARFLSGIFILIVVCLSVPASAEAQSGGSSVILRGTVSETVALSIPTNSVKNDFNMNVVNSGSMVRVTLSGTSAPDIRVPLLIRSNSNFKITAEVESETAVLTQLAVVDVRATGAWVSPGAVSDLKVAQQFDRRGLSEDPASVPGASPLDISRPLFVLSGRRASLGGTLESPNNALRVTFLIRISPQAAQGWVVNLTFAGTAVSIF